MAISFLENQKSHFEKRQKKLLLLLGFLLGLFIFLLINQGYLGKIFSFPKKEIIPKEFKKIEIDFNIFKNPFLKELGEFERLEVFEIKEFKRNPFLRIEK